jgi:hypothetical protein
MCHLRASAFSLKILDSSDCHQVHYAQTFVDTLCQSGGMPETQAKAIAKALDSALNQGLTKSASQNIVKTRRKVQHPWLYVLVTLMVLTSAVALHVYQATGLMR